MYIQIGTYFNTPFQGGPSGRGFATFVSIVVSNAIIIAGVILLFLLVGGGIAMIAGAGQGNPETAAKGRQAVTSAAIGFAIIFVSYWIIQIIEVITGFAILRSPL